MIWKIQLWCAEHLGWYQYEGLSFCYRGPRGMVLYPDGFWSTALPLGIAVRYARMNGGTVHPPLKV
jgi:hypothetical protein